MQRPGWSSTYQILPRYTAPPHPALVLAFRAVNGSGPLVHVENGQTFTRQPVNYALLLAKGLLFPHYEGRAATAQLHPVEKYWIIYTVY